MIVFGARSRSGSTTSRRRSSIVVGRSPETFRVTDGMQGKERFVAEGRAQPVYRRIADELRTAILEGPIGRETSCPAKTS
jgi:hypothetical protein